MSYLHIPTLKPIPEGATEEDRLRMFEEYKSELIKFNPRHFNADGTVKTLWQSFMNLFGK